MLEDKIIVQDRGFDAGLAALMQNANKGNMDPSFGNCLHWYGHRP
jgi:hypothetical protein